MKVKELTHKDRLLDSGLGWCGNLLLSSSACLNSSFGSRRPREWSAKEVNEMRGRKGDSLSGRSLFNLENWSLGQH